MSKEMREQIDRVKNINRILNEGLDDKWIRDDTTVTLKQLLDIIKDVPVQNIPTEKLKDVALPLHKHSDELEKIEKSNLDYPVLIIIDNNGNIEYILDGNHRVQKAIKYDLPSVKAKLIRIGDLPQDFQYVLSETIAKDYMNKGGSNLNDNFRRWFGDSVVVNHLGDPLVVYHGTPNVFDRFDKSKRDLGFHLGTNAQAENRVDSGNIMKLYVRLQNPYDVVSDLGAWDDVEMLGEYLGPENAELFTQEEIDSFESVDDYRKVFIEKGYDGLVYENSFEGQGVSYIVFNPNHIKSIDNDGSWDIDDDNIYS